MSSTRQIKNCQKLDYWARSYKDKRIENGVQRISVTDKFIYLLYDPNKDNNKRLDTEIWIFDWEGNPLRRIITNSFIETFCVDNSNTILYGICKLPEYTLCRINLKD